MDATDREGDTIRIVWSPEWENREARDKATINELIDRVLWLERKAGVEYDRTTRQYKPIEDQYDEARNWYPDEGQF